MNHHRLAHASSAKPYSTYPRRGQGHQPFGDSRSAVCDARCASAPACAALLHALEGDSLREPFRKGFQRTPRGNAPTHVAAQLEPRTSPFGRASAASGGAGRPGIQPWAGASWRKTIEMHACAGKAPCLAKNHLYVRHDRYIFSFCVLLDDQVYLVLLGIAIEPDVSQAIRQEVNYGNAIPFISLFPLNRDFCTLRCCMELSTLLSLVRVYGSCCLACTYTVLMGEIALECNNDFESSFFVEFMRTGYLLIATPSFFRWLLTVVGEHPYCFAIREREYPSFSYKRLHSKSVSVISFLGCLSNATPIDFR